MTTHIALLGDPDTGPHSSDLAAARRLLGPDVETTWIGAAPALGELTAYDGVWVTGDGYADRAPAVAALAFARETGLPVLAIGAGLGLAIEEFTGVPASAVVPAGAGEVPGRSEVVPVAGSRFAALLGGRPFTGTHDGSPVPDAATVDRLRQQGWAVEATGVAGTPEVLTWTPHPFLVLTRFRPEAGAAHWGQVHPVLHAFVDLARRTAPARSAVLEQRRLAIEEARPRDYVHQMRGPRYRWWRPVVTLVLFLVAWLMISAALTIPFALAGQLPDTEEFSLGVGTNLWMNLLLAGFIPAGLVATRIGHWRPAGRVLSVTGRVRWGWLFRCMALVTPLWIVYLTVSWFAFDQEVLPRPEQWVGLLVVTLLTTPFQAAGEEVAFRGVLVQAVAAWFARPWVGLVVSTVVSFALFAAAHGSMDPWIWIDLGALALFGCWLSWRTGGLEAAIALHVVNNLTITFAGIVLGGLEESYVDTGTTGSPLSAGLSMLVMGTASALILWDARRRGVAPAGHTEPSLG